MFFQEEDANSGERKRIKTCTSSGIGLTNEEPYQNGRSGKQNQLSLPLINNNLANRSKLVLKKYAKNSNQRQMKLKINR